ncbi:MAG: hypothetical protein ABWZ99_12495 [Ilumatobacteraceae bacterium]
MSIQRQFQDDGFEFDRLMLLGGAYRGLTDAGEVLVALDAVVDGDKESWIAVFTSLGERLLAQADLSLAGGHRASARAAYLRASAYFATASASSPGTSDPDRFVTLWERHRAAWDAAVPLFDPPVEAVEIPYEGTTLAGYFFHANPTASPANIDGGRPTIILNNGSDGPVSDMWRWGAAAAVERGWNAITFDGPGQNSALHHQHLPFRADWEAVITPVVDWLVGRREVDRDAIVLHGVSQAGYWVPRAIAFEHRIAAAVADPGVVRVGDSWRSSTPDVMLELLDDGDATNFDAFMHAGMAEDPVAKALVKWRMAPYGTESPFEAYTAADAMSLDTDTMDQIRCPLLITDPDGEQFWPGQSAELHAGVAGSTLMRFTEAEGAAWHCEPAAAALRDERVFDWLDDVLARRPATVSAS